jgi:hypothetical protein
MQCAMNLLQRDDESQKVISRETDYFGMAHGQNAINVFSLAQSNMLFNK